MFLRASIAQLISVTIMIVTVLALAVYAYFIEPHWVEETHWELRAEHWKGRPLRLAVIADLHAWPDDGDYLDGIVQRVMAAQPDIVLLLGDYVNEPPMGESMDAEALGRHLGPLAQFPCYAVLGNHDYIYGKERVEAILQGLGAQMMEGKVEALEVGGDTLHLVGMRCQCTYSGPGTYDSPVPEEGATCLVITHSPVGAHRVPKGTTATLCAHTHGGQICLPGGKPLYKDYRLDWHELRGAFEVNGKPCYVTRGLGTSRLPLRLFSRPELLFVELLPAVEAQHTSAW